MIENLPKEELERRLQLCYDEEREAFDRADEYEDEWAIRRCQNARIETIKYENLLLKKAV